jgi:hypothetical protein
MLGLIAVATAGLSGTAHAATKVGFVWANCPSCTGSYTPESSYAWNSSTATSNTFFAKSTAIVLVSMSIASAPRVRDQRGVCTPASFTCAKSPYPHLSENSPKLTKVLPTAFP